MYNVHIHIYIYIYTRRQKKRTGHLNPIIVKQKCTRGMKINTMYAQYVFNNEKKFHRICTYLTLIKQLFKTYTRKTKVTDW